MSLPNLAFCPIIRIPLIRQQPLLSRYHRPPM